MARHNRRQTGRPRWDDDEPRAPRRGSRSRRQARRQPVAQPPKPEAAPIGPVRLIVQEAPPEAKTCGRCSEWVADEEGGRGECLHPGSGFLRPWWETPACPFFR